jgi:transcriptional regulator with XRE-family HTH domain
MSHATTLQKAMDLRKLTDHDLAKLTGIDITLIRRYLRSEVRIGLRNAPRLATTLNISIESLIYGDAA